MDFRKETHLTATEPTPSAPSPRKPRTRAAVGLRMLALVVLAAASHAWVVFLPFQIEDFQQVGEAISLTGPAALLGDTTGTGDDVFIRFFRPLLHLSLHADMRLFGLDAAALHASSVVYHIIVVLLLYLTLRAGRDVLGLDTTNDVPFLAAILFAVHPGAWGAVAWIAARGDVIAAGSLLLALRLQIAWRGGGSRAYGWTSVAACGAAMLAKESAIVFPLALVAVDVFVLRRGQSRPGGMILDIAFIAVTIVAATFRRLAFGSSHANYLGVERTMSFEVVERMIGDVVPTLRGFFAGSFYVDGDDMTATVASLVLILVAIGCVVAVVRARRIGLAVGFALVASFGYAVTVAPSLRFFVEGSGVSASRLFYVPGLFLMTFAAVAIDALAGRGRRRSWKLLAVFIVVLAPALINGVERIRDHLEAARVSQEINDVVERLAMPLSSSATTATTLNTTTSTPSASTTSDVSDPSRSRIFVVGLPFAHRHCPLYGIMLGRAFAPPFRSTRLRVRDIETKFEHLLCRDLHSGMRSAQVVRWNAETNRLEEVGGRLAPPTRKDRVETFDDSNTGRVMFASPVVTRGIRRVMIEVDVDSDAEANASQSSSPSNDVAKPAPGSVVIISVRFVSSTGLEVTRRTTLLPTTTPRIEVSVGGDLEWIAMGTIAQIDVEFVDVTETIANPETSTPDAPHSLTVRRCAFLHREPILALVAPKRDQRLSARGPEPTFSVRDPKRSSHYRLTFADPMNWTVTVARQDCEIDSDIDDVISMRLSTPSFDGAPAPFRWNQLSEAGNLLDRLGVASIRVEFRVDALPYGPSGPPGARTPFRPFFITR